MPTRTRDPLLCLVSVMVLATVLCSTAEGQPYFDRVESLEWRAADSKVIVRATIDQIDRELVEDGATVYAWDTVTVKVHETLKGTHQPTIKCLVRDGFPRDRVPEKPDEDLAKWKKGQQELLLFLVDSERLKKVDPKYAEHKLTLRPAEYWHWKGSCVVLDKRARSNALTLNLQVLTDPQVILQRTRAAIAAATETQPAGKHVVRWPGYQPPQSARGGFVYLTVPVDQRLEEQAHQWVKAEGGPWIGLYPDKERPDMALYLSSSGQWVTAKGDGWKGAWLREEGARALAYFKSDANVAILKRLLEDPFFAISHERGDWRVPEARQYLVRQAAYASLKKLGAKVGKPVLSEPLPDKTGGEKGKPASVPLGQTSERSAQQAGAKQRRQTLTPEDAVRFLVRDYRAKVLDGTVPPRSWPEKIRKVGNVWVADIDTSRLPGGAPEQIVVEVTAVGGGTGRPKYAAIAGLRQRCIEAGTPKQLREARRAFLANLKGRYSGIDASVKGPPANEHGRRFSGLMMEWNPFLFEADDLKSIAGKPTRETPDRLEYHFDNGWDGCLWRFTLDVSGTITAMEYVPGE